MITVTRNQGTTTEVNKGVQFLSPNHIFSTNGETAKITKFVNNEKNPDKFGNVYTVYFEFNGGKYCKGYKPTSDALATLVDLFGTDEKKWVGKTVIIGKHIDDDGGARLTYSAAK